MKLKLIHPPDRTSPTGSVLVILLITLYTLRYYISYRSAIWILAVIAVLTATALLLRADTAVHSGLLGLLILIVSTIPALMDLWPLSAVLAIGVYGGIILPSRRLRASAGWARTGRLNRGDVLLGAVFAVVAGLGLLGWILLASPDLSDLVATVPKVSVGLLILFGLLFASLNAFAEEVLYRGVFMYALEASLGSQAAALIIQAIFFGLLHIQGFPRGISGMVLAGVFGLMLGYLRLRTRGMLAPWITHAAVNGMMYLLLVYQAQLAPSGV